MNLIRHFMKNIILIQLFITGLLFSAIGQKVSHFAPDGFPISDINNYSYNTGDGYKIERQNGVFRIKDATGATVIDTFKLIPTYLGNGFFCLSETGSAYSNWIYKGNKKIMDEQVELYYSGFVNDLLKVQDKNKKYYLISVDGKMSKPFDGIFEDYEAIRANTQYKDKNGYPKWKGFLIDRKTLEEKSLPYHLNCFSEGLAQTTVDGKEAFAGPDGNLVIPGMKKIKYAYSFYNGMVEVEDNKGIKRCMDKTGKILETNSCIGWHPGNVNGIIITDKDNYELNLKSPYIKQNTTSYRYDKDIGLYGYKTDMDYIVVKNKSSIYEVLNYKGELLGLARSGDVEAYPGFIYSNSGVDKNSKYLTYVVDRIGKTIMTQPDSMEVRYTNGIFLVSKKPEKKVDAPSPSEKQMCVAFIMSKKSTGFGVRSISYACKYVVVSGTKSSEEAINAAKAKGYDTDSNGYQGISTIADRSLKNLKSHVNKAYQLSDFMVDYVNL